MGRLFFFIQLTPANPPPSTPLTPLPPITNELSVLSSTLHRERKEKERPVLVFKLEIAMMFKSAFAALAVAALSSSSTSTPTVLAASPSLSVQALQEGKIYYAKDVPEMKLSKAPAKAGTLDCRSKRTIPTWNNEEVVVCDSGLCKGAEAMPKLTIEDKTAPPRFSDAQLRRYMKALGESTFFCWLGGRESGREGEKRSRGNARAGDGKQRAFALEENHKAHEHAKTERRRDRLLLARRE